MSLNIASEVNVASSLLVTMSPPHPNRDWRQCFEHLTKELEEIDTRHTSTISRVAIRAERDRVLAFFVTAYHLKDALKSETTVKEAIIEDAVSADPDLALLADLANVNKHVALDRSPRSGHAPAIVGAVGEQSGDGRGGWRLRMTIRHGAQTKDGVECARSALGAWQRLLAEWRLL